MRSLLGLLMLTVHAATAAQPLSVTASVAVTWLDRVDAELAPPTFGEPVSLGSVFPPAVVVFWRGQPGWAFEAATEKVSFSSSGGWPGGRRSTSPENSWRVPIPVQTREPPCGTSAVLTTTCATTEVLA